MKNNYCLLNIIKGYVVVFSTFTGQILFTPVLHASDLAAYDTSNNGSVARVGPEQKELKLSDIITNSITAYGGKDALAQMENLSAYGKQIGGKAADGQAFRIICQGKKWRVDLEQSRAPSNNASEATTVSLQTTDAFDGVSAWHAVGKTISDMPADCLKLLSEEHRNQPFLLTKFREPGYQFTFSGPTQYKQIPVFAIEIRHEDEPTVTLFIEQSNYLVASLVYHVELSGSGDKQTLAVSTDYSEYRPIGGTVFAYKQSHFINDKHAWERSFTNVVLGVTAENTIFNRPGATCRLDKPVVVPFNYSQKQIIIKARMNNGDELDFLFDTGASDTIIDRRAAAEHFLDKQGRYQIKSIGGVVTARTSTIRRLELGNLIVNDVEARILDLTSQSRQLGKPVAGIVGTNIISKYLVTIDYSKPALTFADAETTQRPGKASVVPFRQRNAPFVKAALDGKDELMFLADTGAAFNYLPFNIAERYAATDMYSNSLKHMTEGTGLDGRSMRLGGLVIENVAIGSQSARKVSFAYPVHAEPTRGSTKISTAQKSNLSEGDRDGFFRDAKVGILGNPFWQNFIVTVDYKFQRFLLRQNPIVKIRSDIEQSLTQGDESLICRRDYRLAENAYQRALLIAQNAADLKNEARLLGRLGNLRRVMAHDLARQEHAKASYQYFLKAQDAARRALAPDVEGRILADWSLLYSDNGQLKEAKQTIDHALILASQDPNVNVDCAVHLYRARMFPEMQKYVDKALFLEPNNWQALWYQVKLSETFFDFPRAAATLKDILRHYPWSNVAKEKLKALGPQAPQSTKDMIITPARRNK